KSKTAIKKPKPKTVTENLNKYKSDLVIKNSSGDKEPKTEIKQRSQTQSGGKEPIVAQNSNNN
ncbi:2308_t:CDS:1, partial [Cetraspora pellucida]